jgi:hypothetical protein
MIAMNKQHRSQLISYFLERMLILLIL